MMKARDKTTLLVILYACELSWIQKLSRHSRDRLFFMGGTVSLALESCSDSWSPISLTELGSLVSHSVANR